MSAGQVEPIPGDDRITVSGRLSSGTMWTLCESPACLEELRDALDDAIRRAAMLPPDDDGAGS